MSIDLETTMERAVRACLTRRAGLLVLGFLALGVVSALAATTAQVRFVEFVLATDAVIADAPPAQIERLRALRDQGAALALPIPLWAAGLTALVAFVVRELLRLVGIRLFAADDPDAVATTELTRRLGIALVYDVLVVVLLGVLFATVFAIAGVTFVVPPLGLLVLLGAVAVVVFLSVTFAFAKQEIALNDAGPIEALSASWQLTAGHRLLLFLILLLLGVLNVGASVVTGLLGSVLPRVVATGLTTAVGAVVLAFSIAVVTTAYLAVSDAEPDPPDDAGASEFDDPPGIDADW